MAVLHSWAFTLLAGSLLKGALPVPNSANIHVRVQKDNVQGF